MQSIAPGAYLAPLVQRVIEQVSHLVERRFDERGVPACFPAWKGVRNVHLVLFAALWLVLGTGSVILINVVSVSVIVECGV